jgi:hypothetical protein
MDPVVRVQYVALVDDHVTVGDCPELTEVGEEVRETVGAGVVTTLVNVRVFVNATAPAASMMPVLRVKVPGYENVNAFGTVTVVVV